MTTYSLTADSPRWWWPSAAAGAVGLAAVTTILVLPPAVQAVPEQPAPVAPASSGLLGVTTPDRPCFLVRARWNEAIDGPQPLCGGQPPSTSTSGVRRAGVGYLP